jgi:alkylation response protein AidB-like acyl-CoA dehydrogenase
MSQEGVSSWPLSTIGNRGTLGEVRFEEVRVGEDAIIGLEGQGLLLQIRRLAHERAFVAVILVAMADALLRALITRLKDNASPGKRNAVREAVHMRMAELLADLEEARWLAYGAVDKVAAGGDARTSAAMAKLKASHVLRAVADGAMLLGGTTAYMQDSHAWGAYADALGFAFAGGTDNMLLEAIAR